MSFTRANSWIPYAGLLVVFWGVWGAISSLPTKLYAYPDPMVYVVWALTMLVPAWFSLRGRKFDRGRTAAGYGLLIGLTGAGGQLVLFKALTIGPAYVIFPIVALSPAVTVLLAFVALRERLGGWSWDAICRTGERRTAANAELQTAAAPACAEYRLPGLALRRMRTGSPSSAWPAFASPQTFA